MNNLFDYVHWRGDLSFETVPLNEVDAAVFSTICYMHLGDFLPKLMKEKVKWVKIHTVADAFVKETPEGASLTTPLASFGKSQCELLQAIRNAPRYQNVRIGLYQERLDYEVSQQFAAMTFLLPGDADFVVCYRGTDNTMVGWKEDFQLMYKSHLPAQESARAYLHEVIGLLPGRFTIAGHSKGGNLAVYAGFLLDEEAQGRLRTVYSFDGPGFEPSILTSVSTHPFADRIVNLLPKESIVGMMLPLVGQVRVIGASGQGVAQHVPFTWEVDVNEFAEGQLSDLSKLVQEIVQGWLEEVSMEERETLVSIVFDMFGAEEGSLASDTVAFTNFTKTLFSKYPKLGSDAQTRLNQQFALLSNIARKSIADNLRERFELTKEELITRFEEESKKRFS